MNFDASSGGRGSPYFREWDRIIPDQASENPRYETTLNPVDELNTPEGEGKGRRDLLVRVRSVSSLPIFEVSSESEASQKKRSHNRVMSSIKLPSPVKEGATTPLEKNKIFSSCSSSSIQVIDIDEKKIADISNIKTPPARSLFSVFKMKRNQSAGCERENLGLLGQELGCHISNPALIDSKGKEEENRVRKEKSEEKEPITPDGKSLFSGFASLFATSRSRLSPYESPQLNERMPTIPQACIERLIELEAWGAKGLFLISGEDRAARKALKKEGLSYIYSQKAPHILTEILTRSLKKQPKPIIPAGELRERILSCAELKEDEMRKTLRSCLEELPAVELKTLQSLMKFLNRVAVYNESDNLSALFAPLLFRLSGAEKSSSSPKMIVKAMIDQYHTLFKKFTLSDIKDFSEFPMGANGIPQIIDDCINRLMDLESYRNCVGVSREGFSYSGVETIRRLSEYGEPLLSENPHDIMQLLKEILMAPRSGVIPDEIADQFFALFEKKDLEAYRQFLDGLPAMNWMILKRVILFFSLMAANEPTSRMNAESCGTCLGNNLVKIPVNLAMKERIMFMQKAAKISECIVQNYNELFPSLEFID